MDKIQTGLRIPQDRYEELCGLSKGMGVSLNALSLMLIDLGLKAINLGVEQAAHADAHNPRYIGE